MKTLIPYNDDRHFENLLKWRNDLDDLHFWYPLRRPAEPGSFRAEMQSGGPSEADVRFMIQHGKEIVGSVHAYRMNATNLWAFTGLYVIPALRNKGIGPLAWIEFVRYLMSSFPLRLVYAEIYGFNQVVKKTCENAGFSLEATLPQHIYWDGQFWDMYTFALRREELSILDEAEARISKLLN